MKKLFLLICFYTIVFHSQAQILRVATSSSAISSQIPGYSQVSTINTKSYSYTPSIPQSSPTPIDEDSTTEDNKLYNYGDNISVDINTADGNITATSEGKVWTLRISIPNALNIGLAFTSFNLSPNAEMYIFNEARTVLDSAIKTMHFTNSNTIGIASLKGNSVIIYIIEPGNSGAFQSTISIQNLIAGFQELADVGESNTGGPAARASINCNPFIQCQQSKVPFARAVARFSSNGFQGTGTLINNEGNNGRAYFLTAFHVLDVNRNILGNPTGNGVLDPDEIAALARATFQFQFWRTQCNGTANNDGLQFSGAVVRAAWPNSDVVLLELINAPGIGDLVNYAGWSRQINSPSDNASFVIHHPEGEDMRITSTSNVKNWIWNTNFWTAHYFSGTVAPGSSGSALMNENGQIVGQLRSGWSSCNYTDFGDRYGKFERSWNGAGLQSWLSPNQGLQSTGLLNLTEIPINGPAVISCTSPTQYTTLAGLLDVTYTWTVSSGLQILSGQGTASVTISGLPNNQFGSGTLTLTLNSPTKGRIRVYTTSKNITINTGGAGSISGTYASPSSNTELLVSPINRFDLTTFNAACLTVVTNMTIPWGATVSWTGSANSSEVTWYQSANNLVIYFNALNQTADMKIDVTTSCGTTSAAYRFKCTSTTSCGGISPLRVALSPNPASSSIQISLEEKADKTKKRDIREVQLIDKMGNLKLKNNYGSGQKIIYLNVSSFPADVYTIQIFDGHLWTSEKFIKN